MIARLAAVVAVAFIVWGCGGSDGGGGTQTPGSTSAAPGEGSLIISYLNAINERNLETGSETTLLSTDVPSSFLLDAAASPDGSRIAYVAQPPAEIIDGRFDAGSDLWVMNRDGSDQRQVFEHQDPNQLVRFPRWEDVDHVIAIVTEVTTEEGITRVLYTLQRFTLATGARERVLDDVLSFDVSPDGQTLAYARLMPQTGEQLAAAAVDGTNEAVLVGPDQLLQPFGYPRFSPDGATVAFASADQTGAPTPTGLVSIARSSSGRFGPGPDATLMDGLPQDIWTVDATGGQAVLVADLKEDLPSLTWDGSGERIYVIGVSGLYEIELRSGIVNTLGEGAFHAQLSWAPAD